MTNSNNANVRLNLTLPALERLIGDNPQLQIELSQQVCDAFIRNTILKSLETSVPLQAAKRSLQDEIDRKVKQELGIVATDWYGKVTNWKIPTEWQSVFDNKIKELIDKQLSSLNGQIENMVASELKHKVEYYTDSQIKSHVKKQVADAVATLTKGLGV